MNTILCSNASINDLKEIMDIIKDAKELLKSSGSTQWNLPDGYPDACIISSDINNHNLYKAMINNKIVGIISILSKDSNYDTINGKWLSNHPYISLHRIAIKKEYYHMGIGNYLINYAIQYAKKRNIKSIKVDTHSNNIIMKKLLIKNNFKYCGIITLLDKKLDNLREAYELVL
ncbi:MAG: GNAT family N-acetyltransferase [Anaeroplasmataceae bacterium]